MEEIAIMAKSSRPDMAGSASEGKVFVLGEVRAAHLRFAFENALSWLEANRSVINDLNVFPVPDGDTGSNMFMTLRSAVDEGASLGDTPKLGEFMRSLAHGALMGARGNSGVILSQIIRGFAQGIGQGEQAGYEDLVRAWSDAATVAYRAVMKPTEGTMLTVIRVTAEKARQFESNDIVALFEALVIAAHDAVEKTPEQLAILKEAGVVDAGGFGLAIILEGMWRALQSIDPQTWSAQSRGGSTAIGAPTVRNPRGSAHEGILAPSASTPSRELRGAAAVAAREEGWGFCTEFLIHDVSGEVEAVRTELAALGDSALVVGEPELVKVHIHTFDPNSVIAAASLWGRLSNLKVDDMSKQHHDILEVASISPEDGVEVNESREIAVVAVAQGEGFRTLMKSLGASVVVEGGQTMNPSIEDLLHAVRETHASHVVLLPNNSNIVMTADQVQKVGGDEGVAVHVIPTKTLPEGVAALFGLEGAEGVDNIVSQMTDLAQAIRSVEITRAVRNSRIGGRKITSGDVLAISGEDVIAVGTEPLEVIEEVVGSAEPKPEIVTLYYGSETAVDDAESLAGLLRGKFSSIEFELHEGGQSHYPYILSFE